MLKPNKKCLYGGKVIRLILITTTSTNWLSN